MKSINTKSNPKVKVCLNGMLDGARALAYIKRRNNLTIPETKWLVESFFKPVAKEMRNRAQGNYAENRFRGVSRLTEDDIFGELQIFFWTANITRVNNVDNFVSWFFVSGYNHVRDAAPRYELGGKTVPRIRAENSKKVREQKSIARHGNALITDNEGNAADEQNAIEAEALSVKEIYNDDLLEKIHSDAESRDLVNLMAVRYPVVFSRMYVGLASDEIFLTTRQRISLGEKEVNEMLKLKILDESKVKAIDIIWYLRRWVRAAKTAGKINDINWNYPRRDKKKKEEFLQEIGLNLTSAKTYLAWLRKNYRTLNPAPVALNSHQIQSAPEKTQRPK